MSGATKIPECKAAPLVSFWHRTHVGIWGSLADWRKAIVEHRPGTSTSGCASPEWAKVWENYAGKEWTGGWTNQDWRRGVGKDMQEGMERIATEGYAKGAERIRELRDACMERVSDDVPMAPSRVGNVRRRRARGDQGDEVDMDDVYGGRLERAWHTFERRRSGTKPTVTIVGKWGGWWNLSADQLSWPMSAAAALADILESRGFRCAVVTICPATYTHRQGAPPEVDHDGHPAERGGRIRAVTAIELKAPEDPVRHASLAVGACGGFFRAAGFWGTAADPCTNATPGFGANLGRELGPEDFEDHPHVHGTPIVLGEAVRDADAAAAAVVDAYRHTMERAGKDVYSGIRP